MKHQCTPTTHVRSAFFVSAGVFALLALFTLASCTPKAAASGKPVVAVSILPQAWFLENISGGRIETLVLVGPGQNPHSYEPTPRQMGDLASAKAWILSGTDFEISLDPKIRSLYPALTIVDGTDGVTFRSLEEHDHEAEGTSAKTQALSGDIEIDRHSWLGREPVKIMATHIRDTLTAIDPEGIEVYEANYLNLISRIDGAFDELAKELAPLSGSTVFVFHPSFGYFLDEFGIHQEAVETGGKEPTAQALAALITEAQADKPAAIFVQAQFPAAAAQTIADACGAKVIPLDPLAPDWLTNINVMGKTLHDSLGTKP
jgi:zinc transport system substrate-binding protein